MKLSRKDFLKTAAGAAAIAAIPSSALISGVWLPQLRAVTVTVDGEKFEGDKITWLIDGKSYAQADLQNYPDVHWSSLTPAILMVKKSGGLPLGIHDVEVRIIFSTSYLPPRMDLGFGGEEPFKRRMTLVR